MLVFLSGEREIHDVADALRRQAPTRHARCCRSTPGCRRPSSTGSSSPTAAAASCCHERRRDVDHRARRALRRRRRHGADLAVQPPAQGPAAADRAGLAGVGQPARRPLRPRRAGHLHPPVQRGRLRRPRPEFTEPEILRTNLASVILQMTAIGLGDVARFPFVEPPDRGADPRRLPPARRARRARPPATARAG